MKKRVLISLLAMGGWVTGCGCGDDNFAKSSTDLSGAGASISSGRDRDSRSMALDAIWSSQRAEQATLPMGDQRGLKIQDGRTVKWSQNNEQTALYLQNGDAALLFREKDKNVSAILIFTPSQFALSNTEFDIVSLSKQGGGGQYKVTALNQLNYHDEVSNPKLAMYLPRTMLESSPLSNKLKDSTHISATLSSLIKASFIGSGEENSLDIELIKDKKEKGYWIVVDAQRPGEYSWQIAGEADNSHAELQPALGVTDAAGSPADSDTQTLASSNEGGSGAQTSNQTSKAVVHTTADSRSNLLSGAIYSSSNEQDVTSSSSSFSSIEGTTTKVTSTITRSTKSSTLSESLMGTQYQSSTRTQAFDGSNTGAQLISQASKERVADISSVNTREGFINIGTGNSSPDETSGHPKSTSESSSIVDLAHEGLLENNGTDDERADASEGAVRPTSASHSPAAHKKSPIKKVNNKNKTSRH